MAVVFLDIETTGLNVERERIITIGCIDYGGTKAFSGAIFPEVPVGFYSARVNGFQRVGQDLYLRDEKVETKSENEVMREFVAYLENVKGQQDLYLVGFNSYNFDFQMIARALQRQQIGQDILQNTYIVDSMHMAQYHFKRTFNCSLDDVLVGLGFPSRKKDEVHTALDDAKLTRKIALEIIGNLGINGDEEYVRFIEKYAGYRLESALRKEFCPRIMLGGKRFWETILHD